jgi:hypothetical protein
MQSVSVWVCDGIAIDIDSPTVSLYAGSYLSAGNTHLQVCNMNYIISYMYIGGNNGDLTTATFFSPHACQYSKSTNQLYIAENTPSTLRRIDMTLGQVYAFSSTVSGYKDGSVLTSQWFNPTGLALDDSAQILYVTDTGNDVVRQIRLNDDGTDGTVSILAGATSTAGDVDGIITAPPQS